MAAPLIGPPLNRAEGRAKVTGQAQYAAEVPVSGLIHLALVTSRAISGRIASIDTAAAASTPGVLGVMTHLNAPRLQKIDTFWLLQSDQILFGGQPIGVVAAETLEQARRAAALVRVTYHSETPGITDFNNLLDAAITPEQVFGQPAATVRGDPEAAFRRTDLTVVDQLYTTPMHIHHPMEPHSVTAWWEGDRVTVHTGTAGLFLVRAAISRGFGLPPENVRVLSAFQGGGFGSKGGAWLPCLALAVSAAKAFGRPIQLSLTREEMFEVSGNRQRTHQRLKIAADASGSLVAIHHEAISETGLSKDFSEMTCFATRVVYQCPHVAVHHRLVRTNTPQPTPMRGPGEGPGSFALESALDELAERLNLDPLELRLRNWAAWDQHANKPWSSNSLRECLQVAADAFEWKRRRPKGSLRDGRLRIGWGMAASYYPGFRAQAAARIRREASGEIVLECGNQEVGNGAFTVMAQAAADRLGVPFDRVRVRYGDTLLPRAPMAAGSMNTASVIPAIDAAAEAFLRKAAVANGDAVIEAEGHSSGADLPHSVSTFGACFVEVAVDPDLGQIRVRRLTAAYAAGRILNAKLAHSQLVGGIVFGMGMALHERVELDTRFGLMTNRSLTDYLLPVHADMPEMQVYLIEEEDPNVPSGVKGLGMNGTVGTAAAIANAVYHATGIRVRDLPIFPEAVLITSPPSSRTARQQ